MSIKAIETSFKGYRMRSRLEARWAVFFDALGIEWEYEKEGYELTGAGRYLPDFHLKDRNIWVEIKGELKEDGSEIEKINALADESKEAAFIVKGSIGEHEWFPCRSFYEHGGFIKPMSLDPNTLIAKFKSSPLDIDFNALHIHCPVCGFEYVHVISCEHLRGNDNNEAWTGRGDAITIQMVGECEHGWKILVGLHKGQSFLQITDVFEVSYDLGRFLAKWDEAKYLEAVKSAKSARFEFGEKGLRTETTQPMNDDPFSRGIFRDGHEPFGLRFD
jgi:hypothetical protein